MSETTLKIESQDLSIESLYKDFYTVPDFQRNMFGKGSKLRSFFKTSTMNFSMKMVKSP